MHHFGSPDQKEPKYSSRSLASFYNAFRSSLLAKKFARSSSAVKQVGLSRLHFFRVKCKFLNNSEHIHSDRVAYTTESPRVEELCKFKVCSPTR